jgi:hypothetical protein
VPAAAVRVCVCVEVGSFSGVLLTKAGNGIRRMQMKDGVCLFVTYIDKVYFLGKYIIKHHLICARGLDLLDERVNTQQLTYRFFILSSKCSIIKTFGMFCVRE